jgi:sn-glycerol 3-phosphate transport system substrate-binding protein
MTPMRRSGTRLVALAAALALTLAACGGDDDSGGDNGAAPGPSRSELPECDVKALDGASGVTEITMWHSMTQANETALKSLTDEFNESQDQVRVKLVNQTSYTDTRTKFRAGLGTGELPDIAQIEDTALQFMIDSQSVLPAQSCVDAEKFDTSDYVDRVLHYYTVADVLWPMPFNVSNPILYYDRALFQKAGLDPDKPPTTLDEIRSASEKIVQSGVAPHGIAMRSDAWFMEQWLAMGGHTFVDNDNGREKRATKTVFGEQPGLDILTWMQEMAADDLLLGTGSQEGNIDEYLAIGNSDAAMTIQTSAALGQISVVLGQGQFAHVELGAAPLPGPEGDGGRIVGGAALYITNAENSTPEKQAAAWEFAKFLTTPESQAKWSAGTGYIPIRKSSAKLEPLATRWQEQPYYKIPYDQLLTGEENVASAGPVIGPYGSRGEGVRGAVIEALDNVMVQKKAAKSELDRAVESADKAIADYNSRVGG